jgi:hypothetical protein
MILGKATIRAAASLEEEIGIKQNTAAALAAAFEAAFGRPPQAGPPAFEALAGKVNEYAEAKAVHAIASAAYRDRFREARVFCGKVVDSLKTEYGRNWGPLWAAVGFTGGSIAVSKLDPSPLLGQLAAYFRSHPEHEVPAKNLTAARAHELDIALESARGARETARVHEAQLLKERNLAVKALRARISGLQNELRQLLSAEDPRWHRFGFNRPADGRKPAPVEEVEVAPAGPSKVIVKWSASAVALNYRVTWRRADGEGVPIDVGLFGDRMTVVEGLPIGEPVVIGVSARNRSGETFATEVSILVT